MEDIHKILTKNLWKTANCLILNRMIQQVFSFKMFSFKMTDHVVGDSPKCDAAVARSRNDELIVDPSHVEDPVLMSTLNSKVNYVKMILL